MAEGFVVGGDFTHQHAHGPAVRDDVVQVEHQHVLGRSQPQQQGVQQRARGQVEAVGGLA